MRQITAKGSVTNLFRVPHLVVSSGNNEQLVKFNLTHQHVLFPMLKDLTLWITSKLMTFWEQELTRVRAPTFVWGPCPTYSKQSKYMRTYVTCLLDTHTRASLLVVCSCVWTHRPIKGLHLSFLWPIEIIQIKCTLIAERKTTLATQMILKTLTVWLNDLFFSFLCTEMYSPKAYQMNMPLWQHSNSGSPHEGKIGTSGRFMTSMVFLRYVAFWRVMAKGVCTLWSS